MSSVEERLAEEEIDDVEATTGLEEVVQILLPYLNDQKEVQSFKDALKKLGITNISHLDLLEQGDVAAFISVIRFREMIKERSKKREENKNTGAKQGRGAAYVFNLLEALEKQVSLRAKIVKDEELLLNMERTKVIHAVADNFRDHNDVIAEHRVNRIAKSIIETYPTSFGCLMMDDADIEDAAGVMCTSIVRHIRYCQQQELARKRKALGEIGNQGKKRSKSDNFTKAHNFGLDPEKDLPRDYPDGENAVTQETKRSALEEMHRQGERAMEVVMKNMKELYVSIRIDINKRLRIEPLLKRWPFIGMYPVFEAHFEYLTNKSVSDCIQHFGIRYDSLEKFFEGRAHELSKAKASSKRIAEQLKEEIKIFRNLGGNTTNDHRFIFMLRCAMLSMKMQLGELFVHFTDVTSFDEVQASDKFPKDGRPMVAVLGSNPYVQETKAFVVVENRCLSDVVVPVFKGVLMTFMSYFVLKIPYSKAATPVLYFLQSKVFKIKGEGSKTRREKLPNGTYSSNPPKKPQVYLKFVQDYKEYCLTWNVPAHHSQ